jgi:L-threonine-O-3-phosphate decarboxylase
MYWGFFMFNGHGGNLAEIQERYGWTLPEIVDFSTNVNPLGPPPGVLETFQNSFREISSYPDPESRILLKKASLKFDVPAAQILAGNGSTEFIFLIPRALGFRSALIFHPTYQDYEESARLAGCRISSLVLNLNPLLQDLHQGLLKFGGSETMVFICNPNNPTGKTFAGDELRWLIQQHPSHFFIIDEAYVDFQEGEEISLLRFPLERNLIVLRSLTKNFSIPGLRIGLAFSSEAVIRRIREYQDPWSVNTPAQKTGEVLLEQKEFLEESRKWIGKERSDFAREIGGVPGFEPLPSKVNYLLVRLSDPKGGDWLKNELLEEKILIRSCQEMKGLGSSFIRLAVKPRKDRERLLSALHRRKS